LLFVRAMPPFAANALFAAAPSDHDERHDDGLDDEDPTGESRRFDLEDDERTTRRPKVANDDAARPITTTASATLPVGADAAFRAFGDAAETPRWLPVLQAARVLARDDRGRATRVAFVGRLERGSISYTLDYRFDDAELAITWRTAVDAAIQVRGQATFAPLSAQACLMTYSVSIDAPVGPWNDPSFEHHPASSVVTSFREHLRRD
jgi:Polyketide cyclase / dehydrase and lipid transport